MQFVVVVLGSFIWKLKISIDHMKKKKKKKKRYLKHNLKLALWYKLVTSEGVREIYEK